jgi:rod shape-determining protein MreD
MNRITPQQIVLFFVYLLYQVMILQNVVLFHTAFCFLYVLYLIILPVEVNPLVLMGIGFLMGFAIDLFYESIGLHAFASVLLMYVRNYWLNQLTPQGGYDSNSVPSLAMNGVQWFVVYATPLIFLHHALLFFMEAGGFGMFWFTLSKVLTSTIFTTVVILIAQFLFPGRRR